MQKSAAVPLRATPALTVQSLAPYALWTLLAAGLGEMFLYRMLSRVGVHIPKQGLVLDVYNALVRLGSFAFNVSSLVVFLAVALLAYAAMHRWSDRPAPLAAAPALIGAFAALSFLLAFVEESDSLKLAYGSLSAGIMLLLAAHVWTDGRSDWPRRAIVGLIVLAYLAAQYYTLANHAYMALGLTASPPATARALEAAELLVVVNAFLVFWAWSGVRRGLRPDGSPSGRFRRGWISLRLRRPSWLQLGAAALLIVAFGGAYRGEDSSTAAILSLWTIGLTLYLPLPVYVLALGLYGATLVGCLGRSRQHGTRPWDTVALGLLPVAGLTLEMTYQHLVALVALLLLVGGTFDSEEADERPDSSG